MKQNVLIIGLGETGKPLFELIAAHHNVFGIDQKGNVGEPSKEIDVMHICYPFKDSSSFESSVCEYIEKYKPKLTIINSTVIPGTTRSICEKTSSAVAHSPIRGVHARMKYDLQRYTKFIGSEHIDASLLAKQHFESIGMKTRITSKPEATELMKLLSTTYYGMLIVWAQEMNRICNRFGCDYDEIMSFSEEIEQFIGGRPKYLPGKIGGHCVLPNAELLYELTNSEFIKLMKESNALRKKELGEDD